MTTKLTKPQARMLAQVRAAGPAGRVYNGRAAKMIEVLEAAGLVQADWDLVPHARGDYTWRITVVAVAPGGRAETEYDRAERDLDYTPRAFSDVLDVLAAEGRRR